MSRKELLCIAITGSRYSGLMMRKPGSCLKQFCNLQMTEQRQIFPEPWAWLTHL